MIPLDSLFPTQILPLVAFLYGIIIGSFLNVYIYRFHTGKSLSGSSHCLSCGTRLKAYDLVPLFSYLWLTRRCRNCKSKITPRYFLVELVTGALFAAATLITTDLILLLLFWWFLSVLVVIAVYDFYHFIIPDRLVIAASVAAVAVVGYQSFLLGTLSHVGVTILAALGGVLFFYSLWWISQGTWLGFGDVKLAFPLGVIVSPAGVFSMVVLSFWVGAVVSVCLVAVARLGRGKLALRFLGFNLTMKSVVPFAPFMIIACLIVLFTNFNVLSLFSF